MFMTKGLELGTLQTPAGFVVGAVVGTLVAITGTHQIIKLSQFFANKEASSHRGSVNELAYKIAKWATLTFAGVIGIAGALLACSSVLSLSLLLTAKLGPFVSNVCIVTATIAFIVFGMTVLEKIQNKASSYIHA